MPFLVQLVRQSDPAVGKMSASPVSLDPPLASLFVRSSGVIQVMDEHLLRGCRIYLTERRISRSLWQRHTMMTEPAGPVSPTALAPTTNDNTGKRERKREWGKKVKEATLQPGPNGSPGVGHIEKQTSPCNPHGPGSDFELLVEDGECVRWNGTRPMTLKTPREPWRKPRECVQQKSPCCDSSCASSLPLCRNSGFRIYRNRNKEREHTKNRCTAQ